MTRLYALAYRTPPFSRASDRFGAGARFAPLLASIPAAVLVVLLQTLTFSTRLSATLAAVGLLALAEAIGHVAVRPPPTRAAAPPDIALSAA